MEEYKALVRLWIDYNAHCHNQTKFINFELQQQQMRTIEASVKNFQRKGTGTD
jgi:hypothetical protein